MNILKIYPQLYTILIPVIAVPVMLSITFIVMKVEIIIK